MVLKAKVTENTYTRIVTRPWGLKGHMGLLFFALGFLSNPRGMYMQSCYAMVMSC